MADEVVRVLSNGLSEVIEEVEEEEEEEKEGKRNEDIGFGVQKKALKTRSLSAPPLGSHELLKPKVTILSPPNKTYEVGEEVRLVCLLTGYPCHAITWYLNGDTLLPTEDGRISFSANTRELIIRDVKPEDNGNILVSAQNKYGETFTSHTLRIAKLSKSKINWNNATCSTPLRRKVSRAFSTSK